MGRFYLKDPREREREREPIHSLLFPIGRHRGFLFPNSFANARLRTLRRRRRRRRQLECLCVLPPPLRSQGKKQFGFRLSFFPHLLLKEKKKKWHRARAPRDEEVYERNEQTKNKYYHHEHERLRFVGSFRRAWLPSPFDDAEVDSKHGEPHHAD